MGEESHKEVRTHLHKLLSSYTVCSSKFLNVLHEKGVLSREEVGLIVQEKSDRLKGDMMYELIRGRDNSYPTLIHGLKETGQEDIVHLLEKGWIPLRLKVKAGMRKILGEGESPTNMAQLTVNWTIAIAEISKLENGLGTTMILYHMAYLSPDQINPELFRNFRWTGGQGDLEAGLKLLAQFGLLPNEGEEGSLSIHPLIQKVTRISLAAKLVESTMIEEVLHMISNKSPEAAPLPPQNLEHVLVAWEHAWKYPDLLKKFSFLVPWTVLRLHESGQDKRGVKFGDAAANKLAPLLSGDHMDVLLTCRATGIALLHQGRFNEALPIVRYALERQKRLFGESHPETVASMSTLATIYSTMGDPEEALALLQRVSAEQSKKLSEYDPDLLQTRQMVAITLSSLGRPLEALDILKKIHLNLKMVPGPNKVLLLSVRSYLGQCLTSLGRFNEALEVLQEDYLDVNDLSGGEGICMNEVISAIGDVLWNTGDYDGALKKHQQVQENCFRIFGEGHPKSLLCKRKMAVDLSWMGRHSEAINLLQLALTQMEALLQADSDELLRWKVLYALVVSREGNNMAKALAILQEVKSKLAEKDNGNPSFAKIDVWNCAEWIENEINSSSSLSNKLETIISHSQDVRFYSA